MSGTLIVAALKDAEKELGIETFRDEPWRVVRFVQDRVKARARTKEIAPPPREDRAPGQEG